MNLPVSSSNVFDREDLALALAGAGFGGDVLGDAASRRAMSTDNSVYRIVPDLIICPRDESDLRRAMAVLATPPFAHLPVTPRGGGTGTNGQSLNDGIIVDLRRHMTRILELNVAEGWVEVEPGIVLDDLNAQLGATGLFFAPTTSTANRCTIGGMVATDASGKGSRIYGKTLDNVLGLRLVLDGGNVLDSTSAAPQWAAERLAEIASACDAGREPLLARVPALSRRFTGYDLERARPSPGRLDWWRLVIGAEGTLGIVTRVRLKLTPKPRRTMLTVLAFDSFDAALAAAPRLIQCDPLAIEAIDETVQTLADAAGLLDAPPAAIRGGNNARPVYTIVELAGDDVEAKYERLMAICRTLPGLAGEHTTRQPDEIARLWSVRAASVGLLGRIEGPRHPIAFVEDCVVPPASLAAFVRDFTSILRDHGLFYGIYGHIDVGCLHVRPALDISSEIDRRLLRAISDAVYAAVQRHGGIFWGEHGKGIRGEYLEDFVGPEAYAAFRRIKHAFDPANRFNRGKLVGTALRSIDRTTLRDAAPPGDPFAAAFACNGNAACLSVTQTIAICPSFKATSDLRHSPKGRSEILAAWRARPDDEELAHAAHAALDGCLGCNACANQCPQQVAIPEMKSRFLELYFRKRARPLADHAALQLERHAPRLVPLLPAFRLAQRAGVARALARALNLVDLPSFSPAPPSIPPAMLDALPGGSTDVLLLPDAYTALFDTQAIEDVAAGLRALGYRPHLLPLSPAGKAAHVLGDRHSFALQANRLAAMLRHAGRTGLPIIGIEPSQTMFVRSDFHKNGILDVPEIFLPQEFLHRRLKAGDRWPAIATAPDAATLLLHCTESAALPGAGAQWREVFAAAGVGLTIADTGCCGMAGLYGHQQRHQENSRKLFDLSWARHTVGPLTLATGFSCRCQIHRFSPSTPRHPLSYFSADNPRSPSATGRG